jgi:hypothetical protein
MESEETVYRHENMQFVTKANDKTVFVAYEPDIDSMFDNYFASYIKLDRQPILLHNKIFMIAKWLSSFRPNIHVSKQTKQKIQNKCYLLIISKFNSYQPEYKNHWLYNIAEICMEFLICDCTSNTQAMMINDYTDIAFLYNFIRALLITVVKCIFKINILRKNKEYNWLDELFAISEANSLTFSFKKTLAGICEYYIFNWYKKQPDVSLPFIYDLINYIMVCVLNISHSASMSIENISHSASMSINNINENDTGLVFTLHTSLLFQLLLIFFPVNDIIDLFHSTGTKYSSADDCKLNEIIFAAQRQTYNTQQGRYASYIVNIETLNETTTCGICLEDIDLTHHYRFIHGHGKSTCKHGVCVNCGEIYARNYENKCLICRQACLIMLRLRRDKKTEKYLYTQILPFSIKRMVSFIQDTIATDIPDLI